MISITIYWWYLPIGLFVLPFVYMTFRKPQGDYDFCMLLTLGSWIAAISLVIGHFWR